MRLSCCFGLVCSGWCCCEYWVCDPLSHYYWLGPLDCGADAGGGGGWRHCCWRLLYQLLLSWWCC